MNLKNWKYSYYLWKFLKEYILNNKDIFISILRLDGKDIAFNIGFFAMNNSLEILITSFDSEYRKYDVGNFLLYKSIVSFLESGLAKARGLIYYDLGQGDELYKIKYGGEMHHIKEYLIFNSVIYYSIKKAELRGRAIGRIVWRKILYIFQKEYLRHMRNVMFHLACWRIQMVKRTAPENNEVNQARTIPVQASPKYLKVRLQLVLRHTRLDKG